jgi:hypothetical protein
MLMEKEHVLDEHQAALVIDQLAFWPDVAEYRW